MAYGRLDVFFSDGMSKSYLLVEDNISVGRSTGNTIALETETISRYHMSLTRQNGETLLTDLDSQNGTFVDGKRLQENAPTPLRGGEEILIGDLIIIYHELDENPTRPVPVVEDATRRIEAVQAAFRIDIEPPDIPISPGAHTAATLNITNTGEQETRFVVDVGGVPKEWVRVDRPELVVRPNETDDAIISFKPLRRPDSAPGDYRPQVRVFIKDEPLQALSVEVPLRILPYSGFGVALETKEIKSGGTIRIYLHNQGSSTLPITISGRDPHAAAPGSDALLFNFSPAQLAIAPGERVTVGGKVSARDRRLFGEPQRLPFDILFRSGDASGFLVATRGYVIDQPALPRWSLFAIGGLLLAGLALLAVVLLAVLIPPPAPIIESFLVTPQRVEAGQPLSLNWVIQNSSGAALFVNGAAVATYEADVTGAQLDTTGYDGDLALQLVADGSRATAVATAQASVYIPLYVEYFTGEPQPAVRFVPHDITLSWYAPGATTVDLQGAPGLESLSEGGESGSITIRLLLDETVPAITFTLLAQNELGETAQETFNLNVIDPVCAPSADVLVYQYPNMTSQVVSTILVSSNTPIIVDGQNPEGDWLRVRLGGDAHGWIHVGSLMCAGNFDPADLPVYVSVMPPTATFTPTWTFTSTWTSTATPTRTPTSTFTATRTPTFTLTATPTLTFTATQTLTATATPTPSRTATSRSTRVPTNAPAGENSRLPSSTPSFPSLTKPTETPSTPPTQSP